MKWAGGRSGRAAGVGGWVGEASRTVRRAKLGACWAARAAARACSAPGQHAPALCRQRCIPRRMWDPCTAPAAPAGGGRRPQRRPARPAAAPRPPAPLCTLRRGAPVSSSPRSPRAWRAQSAGTPRPASAGRPGASCRAPSVRREGRGRGGGSEKGRGVSSGSERRADAARAAAPRDVERRLPIGARRALIKVSCSQHSRPLFPAAQTAHSPRPWRRRRSAAGAAAPAAGGAAGPASSGAPAPCGQSPGQLPTPAPAAGEGRRGKGEVV